MMDVDATNPVDGDVFAVPMLIDGQWRAPAETIEVRDPYRGNLVCRAPESTPADVADAVAAAVAAKAAVAAMPAYDRAAMLRRVAALVGERAHDIARTMTLETGKAIRDSVGEMVRAPETLLLSAEEAVRIAGEHLPLDSSPIGHGKLAVMLRFPVGVVGAITPFNSPVNLACHKLGPALAAGNAVVLKAPPQCPWTIHKLIACFVDAGLPPGFVNVLYGRLAGPALVADRRVDFITFTGSTRAGEEVKKASGLRRVALELGGVGPVIVNEDADIDLAADLCARHATRLAGQSCISVQNVHVHRSVHDAFVERLVAEIGKLRVGDPQDENTDIGTVIDEAAARRIEATISAAIASGARALTGGHRHGATIEPTVLVDVSPQMDIVCHEIFGPVLTVRPFVALDPVVREISEHHQGLQGGIFTRSLDVALRVARTMRVGGVIINGTSTWRSDQMPYGGVKDSGIGREGPRYAIEQMTEQRVIVFNQ